MTKKQKRKLRSTLLPVLLVGAVIFFLSAQTAEASARTSSGITALLGRIFRIGSERQLAEMDAVIRQLAHFTEYAAFGFFLRLHLLTRQEIKGRTRWNGLRLCLLIGFLYAVSDEIHQIFVPGRSLQGADILTDVLGVLAGDLILMLFAGGFAKRAEKKCGEP